MGLKIQFYASVKDAKDIELDLLKYYQDTEKGYCIYCIKAAEICSEFIARYFHKTVTMPELLLNKVIEENYEEKDYKNAKQDMNNLIYKANTDKMFNDNNSNFEFKAFKECKVVREKLLDKYEEIGMKLKENIEEPKVEIYALLTV